MFFLSHARSDAASALALATGLKTAGLDVWCDQRPRAMEAGRQTLHRAARTQAERVDGLPSPGGQARRGQMGARRGGRGAQNRQVKEPSYRIVPLLLAGTTAERLPPFLARFHALSLDGDVTRWGRTEFQSLAEHVRSFASRLAVDPDSAGERGRAAPGRHRRERPTRSRARLTRLTREGMRKRAHLQGPCACACWWAGPGRGKSGGPVAASAWGHTAPASPSSRPSTMCRYRGVSLMMRRSSASVPSALRWSSRT
ncbi:TIR domain-containing protein [Archangium sp.]|uniref:TIR domain-containing protein n=1 Tax=Archangium sp. TaxID=1872627 RepID=UPI0038D3AE5D